MSNFLEILKQFARYNLANENFHKPQPEAYNLNVF